MEDPQRSGGLRHAAAGLEGSAARPARQGKVKKESPCEQHAIQFKRFG